MSDAPRGGRGRPRSACQRRHLTRQDQGSVPSRPVWANPAAAWRQRRNPLAASIASFEPPRRRQVTRLSGDCEFVRARSDQRRSQTSCPRPGPLSLPTTARRSSPVCAIARTAAMPSLAGLFGWARAGRPSVPAPMTEKWLPSRAPQRLEYRSASNCGCRKGLRRRATPHARRTCLKTFAHPGCWSIRRGPAGSSDRAVRSAGGSHLVPCLAAASEVGGHKAPVAGGGVAEGHVGHAVSVEVADGHCGVVGRGGA